MQRFVALCIMALCSLCATQTKAADPLTELLGCFAEGKRVLFTEREKAIDLIDVPRFVKIYLRRPVTTDQMEIIKQAIIVEFQKQTLGEVVEESITLNEEQPDVSSKRKLSGTLYVKGISAVSDWYPFDVYYQKRSCLVIDVVIDGLTSLKETIEPALLDLRFEGNSGQKR